MVKTITDDIRYIEASENPLSADIGIIETPNGIWLYDVGYDARKTEGLTEVYNVVLSHFHADHTGNLDRIGIKNLYVSKETQKHTKNGILVTEDVYVDNLHIFLIPSSHAKGCLGLEVDGNYAFIGDAIYPKEQGGVPVYNANFLKEEIEVLKKLKAEYFLISHKPGLIRKKEAVIAYLEGIYKRRKKGESFIFLNEDEI